MSTDNQELDLTALEARLTSLRRELESAVARGRRRRVVMLGVLLVALVVACFYLAYAHREITSYDADTIVMIGEMRLRQEIDQASPELRAQLAERAPQVVDHVEQLLRNAPHRLANGVKVYVTSRVMERMPELGDELYEQCKVALDQAHERMGVAPGAPVDQKQFEQTLEEVARTFGQQVNQFSDQLFAHYKPQADQLLEYLDSLATDTDLGHRELIHRDLIVALLSVIEKYQQGRADGSIPALGRVTR